jgi:glycerol uptake facilitator protein
MSAAVGRPVAKRGWRATLWGELLSEFLGVFILVTFGLGSVAMAIVGLTESGRTTAIFNGAGDWLLITWAFFLAVALAIYVAGGVSGGHINPAATLAFAIAKGFPWKKVVPYWLAQILGAFAGAALVYLLYFQAIDAWNLANGVESRSSEGGQTTGWIFMTFPAPYFNGNLIWPLIAEIVGTAFLVLFVFAIIDTDNMAVQSNLGPFMIGAAVMVIGISLGAATGYPINPAREFGPRLFGWLAGWGSNAFPGPGGYFFVPIIGPLIGGALGAFVYKFFIALTLAHRREVAGER